MAKIQYNGRQFTITIPPTDIKMLGWAKGTDIYIAKDPNRPILYLEKISPKKLERK